MLYYVLSSYSPPLRFIVEGVQSRRGRRVCSGLGWLEGEELGRTAGEVSDQIPCTHITGS